MREEQTVSSVFLRFVLIKIQWTFCLFKSSTLHRMRIDHRGFYIAMPQQFLNRADIIIRR